MADDNFLPKFNISDSLAKDLRTIKIAKALSTGWYKGKFYYHMKKAGNIVNIEGEEYYSIMNLRANVRNFSVKDTAGYHQVEALKLMGLQDKDIEQIRQTCYTDKVEQVYVHWTAKDELSKELFNNYVDKMRLDLQSVDTIEIDYESVKYNTDIYATPESRAYNSRESIYGARLQATESYLGVDVLSWGSIRLYSFPEKITRPTSSCYGEAIRFKTGTTDVTSNFPLELRQAVQTMIAFSGQDFMLLNSSSKIAERTYTQNIYNITNKVTSSQTYISAVGTEIYSARILNSFIKDENSFHYERYTKICNNIGRRRSGGLSLIEQRKCKTGERVPNTSSDLSSLIVSQTDLGMRFPIAFWNYTKYRKFASIASIERDRINAGDEFLFKVFNGRVHIKIREFNKLSIDKIGYYLGNYFDIKIEQDTGGGGFFGGFINFIGGIFGFVLNIFFDIIEFVPALKIQLQLMTWFINMLFDSDLSERDVFDLGMQALGVLLSIFIPVVGTIISVGISIGTEKNKAEREAEKQEEENERKKADQEEDKKQREKEAEENKRKQKIDTKQGDESKDEFEAFLKNPLYRITQERNEIKQSIKSQFKLI